MRKTVIGVMGGGKVPPAVEQMAAELGERIAGEGWILLNGGRNAGVMAASARGARRAGGWVVGILPGASDADAAPDLDVAVVTGMGDARNVINVLSSDVVVACPGELGTRVEIDLALKNNRPVVLLCREPGKTYERYQQEGRLFVASSPAEAVEKIKAILAARRANQSPAPLGS